MEPNNHIANSLNIEPNPPADIVIASKPVEVIDYQKSTEEVAHSKTLLSQEATQDFDKARDNLKILSMLSIKAAEDLHKIASETEAPRAYEVLSTLINTAVEANIQLMQIHDIKNDLEGGGKQIKEINKNVTNTTATFVGTPSDLMDIIRGSLKPKKEG